MTRVCELQKEYVLYLAEHEVLLSFISDDDAELFEDWWQAHGATSFEGYAEMRKELMDTNFNEETN